MKKIFSGDGSKPLWDEINEAESIPQLRAALYSVCCRLQELEDEIRKQARKDAKKDIGKDGRKRKDIREMKTNTRKFGR